MDVRLLLGHTLSGLGYELVDVEWAAGGLLRVFIDKVGGVTLDDCVAVSHHLTRLFVVENIDYERLEVSSPGLDRPLKTASDFMRFTGKLCKVRTRLPIEQQKKFTGRIVSLEEGMLTLETDVQRVVIPLSNIDKARLEPEL